MGGVNVKIAAQRPPGGQFRRGCEKRELSQARGHCRGMKVEGVFATQIDQLIKDQASTFIGDQFLLAGASGLATGLGANPVSCARDETFDGEFDRLVAGDDQWGEFDGHDVSPNVLNSK
jgi:hypothetical protein